MEIFPTIGGHRSSEMVVKAFGICLTALTPNSRAADKNYRNIFGFFGERKNAGNLQERLSSKVDLS